MMKLTIRRKKAVISLTQLGYYLIIIIAVLRAMQFHVNSGDNMDLARHFYMMQLVKRSGYSFFEYVFLHGDAFTSNITLKFNYAFNAIVYLISNYTTNYYIISWVFVFIDYAIIAYIGIDWWKSQGGRKGFMALYEILICFSLLPFFQAVSGLRTAIAACIMGLAIYLYIYKNKSFIYFAIATILAALFHPVFLTAVPFAIIAKKMERKKGLLISVIASVAVSSMANIFIRASNNFLHSIAYKYLQYTGESGYRGTRFCYYGVLVICLLTLAGYFYIFFLRKSFGNHDQVKKALDTDGNSRLVIYDFVAYYMIFILSNFGAYEMVLRPAYLLGAIAPILTGLSCGVQGKCRRLDGVLTILLALLFGISIYVSYMYLIWHNEYFL